MTTQHESLPVLPKARKFIAASHYEAQGYFTADQMREYARAAIAAQGGQNVVSPEVVAWLNTSYGGIHRNCKEIIESAAYENGELVPLGHIVEAHQSDIAPPIDRERLAHLLKIASGKKTHASDCATSNAPAYWPGECDCDCVDDETVRAMNEVAQVHAHGLAMVLECILYDYSGMWYDKGLDAIGKYREAMCEIHERESPTHMGEPLIRKGVPK